MGEIREMLHLTFDEDIGVEVVMDVNFGHNGCLDAVEVFVESKKNHDFGHEN
jgi:hypothetical protein